MLLASMAAGIMTTAKGTSQYWAPELLSLDIEDAKQSEATDVWAFSMTIYVSNPSSPLS